MSALVFVPFKTGHLKHLGGAAAQRWADAAREHPEIAAEYEVKGLALAALRYEAGRPRPVAAAGVRPEFALEDGKGLAGECWTLFDQALSRDEWRDVLAMARAVLARAERQGYRRLTAYVRTDLPFGFKLARRLGFEVEGLLRRWGPMDADTLLMARVAPRAEQREAA